MAREAKKDPSELTVEEKLKALYQLQTMVSEIDKIKTLRGELPLEVQDLEDEVAGLSDGDDDLEELHHDANHCHRHRVLPQNQNGITKQPGGVPKAEASRLRFYKLCALSGYLSRALWSAPPMVNAARGPVWVQTTAISSGASGSAASRASTETVVERESRVVNTRVFTP